MKLTSIAVFLFLFLVPVVDVRSADWPTYRHDNSRSATTAEKIDAEKLELSWVHRAALAPRPAWAGPAKWDAYAGIRGLRSMRTLLLLLPPLVSLWDLDAQSDVRVTQTNPMRSAS